MDLVLTVVLVILAAVMVGSTIRYLQGTPPERPLPGWFPRRRLRAPSVRKLLEYRPPTPRELNADLRVGYVAAALFIAVVLLWAAFV